MKLVNPKFEILEQESGIDGIYKAIERAGRTCYKSDDKITEDSAKKFVEMIINRGHTSVLEHGTVYLKAKVLCYLDVNGDEVKEGRLLKYLTNPYSRIILDNGIAYITTNYRVLYENNWLDDLEYLCEPTKHHIKRVCVKFTTDIGVTREANRHRVNSPSEQSTRYCNYSKDKFGNEITVCTNVDISKDDVLNAYGKWAYPEEQGTVDHSAFVCMCNTIGHCKYDQFGIVDTWIFANLAAEWSYMRLIKLGWIPQQARRVLPLDLSSELVHTAFVDSWEHFFELRCANDAHPDMKALAIPLKEEFINRNYI